MGYSGCEWFWFIMGMGFLGFILFGIFAMIMIVKFYGLLKLAIDKESKHLESLETEKIERH